MQSRVSLPVLGQHAIHVEMDDVIDAYVETNCARDNVVVIIDGNTNAWVSIFIPKAKAAALVSMLQEILDADAFGDIVEPADAAMARIR